MPWSNESHVHLCVCVMTCCGNITATPFTCHRRCSKTTHSVKKVKPNGRSCYKSFSTYSIHTKHPPPPGRGWVEAGQLQTESAGEQAGRVAGYEMCMEMQMWRWQQYKAMVVAVGLGRGGRVASAVELGGLLCKDVILHVILCWRYCCGGVSSFSKYPPLLEDWGLDLSSQLNLFHDGPGPAFFPYHRLTSW